MSDLPDRWADEPWPLDDPVPAPGLRPTNWSDTHDQPPQIADLADEAWELAVDCGISLERALVEVQDRKAQRGFHDPAGTLKVYFVPGAPGPAPSVEEIEAGEELAVTIGNDTWIWSTGECDDHPP